MMAPEYLRLESALSRLAQSGWRWSSEDQGPVFGLRDAFAKTIQPDQAAALSGLLMEALDHWEERRRIH